MCVTSFDDLKTGLANLRRKALQQNEGPLAFAKTNLTAFLDCYDMLTGVYIWNSLLDVTLAWCCWLVSWDSITGWAVALTCYISHCAKHRKMADFDPSGSENSWTDFDETWHGWLRLGLHPHDNFGGGSATWVVPANMWLVTSLSFFSFFFLFFLCFLQHAPRSHFLTDLDNLYAKTHGQWHAFLVSQQYLTTFSGNPPPKKSPGIDISQPNRWSSKIAIYRSPIKTVMSNSTDRLTTGGIVTKKCKIGSKGHEGDTWPTFRILGLPLYLGKGWSNKLQFGTNIDHENHQQKKCEIRSKGVGKGHMTYFWNFGIPPYLWNG